MRVLREIVPPLVCGYAVFVFVVIASWRRPSDVARPIVRSRELAVTIAGGYLTFLSIVAIFHVWLVGDPGALPSAIAGGALLLLMAAPVFALLSWVDARLGERRGSTPDGSRRG